MRPGGIIGGRGNHKEHTGTSLVGLVVSLVDAGASAGVGSGPRAGVGAIFRAGDVGAGQKPWSFERVPLWASFCQFSELIS